MAAADTYSPVDNLTWALRALRDQQRTDGYRIAARYYDGNHVLEFASRNYSNAFRRRLESLVDNLCPAVVDSVADRLKVVGVNSDTESGLADEAWKIWQRNRMDVRAPETHHEALLNGDGYALVWPDETGSSVIWSIPAAQVAVAYDRNRPGVIRKATRLWQDIDGDWRWHLDLYLADRIERWISNTVPRDVGLLPASYTAQTFQPWWDGCGEWGSITEPWSLSSLGEVAAVENPLGKVPLVHFPNRRYHTYGISELANVLPLQDALNKAVADMMVAMEFSAYPQRWATGIDVGEVDAEGKDSAPPFDPGVDRIFAVAAADAKFGDFRETNLEQYVEVQENLRSEIARVSGTPLHYLFITRGDFPSGEAMKSAEARFTRKVENRQVAFGNSWENILAMALQLEGDDPIDPSVLSVKWESASPLAVDTSEGELTPTTVSASERI